MKLKREPATRNRQTYFVTSETSERRPFFRYERWSKLFLEVLFGYREAGNFQLHEFVLMPDHFHLIVTPAESLEKAVQLIKGGFSRQASLQFKTKQNIWQRGFADHRIRDIEDYDKHKHYIWLNPVKARLSEQANEYPYSSAFPGCLLDHIPQGLSPLLQIWLTARLKPCPFKESLMERALPDPKKFRKTKVWLKQIEENRSDYLLASQISASNTQQFSLEEVQQIINADRRTRHRKPRKF